MACFDLPTTDLPSVLIIMFHLDVHLHLGLLVGVNLGADLLSSCQSSCQSYFVSNLEVDVDLVVCS